MYSEQKIKRKQRTRISINSNTNGLHIFSKGELHTIYYEIGLMSYFIIYVKKQNNNKLPVYQNNNI